MSPSRLRARDLDRPYRGIRITVGSLREERDRILAFAPRLPPRAFLFGASAAILWGIPLPPSRTRAVDVAVRAGARRLDAVGVAAHHVRIDDVDIVERDGIRVTTPARTWCDLAAGGMPLEPLVAAGDRIIHRRDGWGTRDDLRRALARWDGRRGSRTLRAAVPLLSERADSAPESIMRVRILAAGFTPPAVNLELRLGSGRRARLDLSWPRELVALEYEGDHHRTDPAQWHRDLARSGELQVDGWRVLRATAADLRDSRALLRRLAQLLRR